jgi:dihydroorotase
MSLLLTNGVLVDETSTLHHKSVSILIEDKRIVEVSPTQIVSVKSDVKVVDLKGAYVSAGWVDMHVHCFLNSSAVSLDPDRIGCESGVTMLIDAGSSGSDNVDEFYKMAQGKKTKVRAMLNISRLGLKNQHELRNIEDINTVSAIAKAKEYSDFVVGFKLRASATVMGEDMTSPFIKAKEIQKEVPKPLMVHVGNFPPSLDAILASLDKGDIITHSYNGKPNGLFNGNDLKKSVLDARKRGIIFDVGHGSASFNFEVAKKAFKLGFSPEVASTDLHSKNIDNTVYSLALTMSKMRSLGFSLDECVTMNTLNVATVLNLRDIGCVKPGFIADLTIFNEVNRDSTVIDSDGNELHLTKQLVPFACLIDGEWMKTRYGDAEHLQ